MIARVALSGAVYSIDKLYEKYTTVDEIKGFYSEWESTVCWLMADAGATACSPEDFGIPRPGK